MTKKVNFEKRLQRMVKRGLTKQASDLQDYLFGKNKRFYGIISHKLTDYMPKDYTPEKWSEEELRQFQISYRNMSKKHLKYYLKGAKTFSFGVHRVNDIPYPNIFPVLDKPLEELEKEIAAFQEAQRELEAQIKQEQDGERNKDTKDIQLDGPQLQSEAGQEGGQ